MWKKWQIIYILILLILLIYLSVKTVEGFVESESLELSETSLRRFYDLKQKIYKELLEDTKRALDSLNIPFFLSSGTCLGYFRDKKFIDHDYDIDVGIMSTDWNNKIIEKMEEQGLKLYRVLGDPQNGMELSFKKSGTGLGNLAKVDLFLHYVERDNKETGQLLSQEDPNEYISWYSYKSPEFVEKIKYRVTKFDLRPVKFGDLEVYVPDPTLNYILEHYGEDWMIPKKPGKDYFYATSPKSIVKSNDNSSKGVGLE